MEISQEHTENLRERGYCIVPDAFTQAEVTKMREIVLQNKDEMPNTRRAEHSRHMAGFERFAVFRQLFDMIDGNDALNRFYTAFFGGEQFSSFGLSDITVNRSQHWHSDLLRGKYSAYLSQIDPWAADAGACIKSLVYLQPGKSLQLVCGSHKTETPLDDSLIQNLVSGLDVVSVPVSAGDIVMMDIRCLHRGSTDEAMSDPALTGAPKILVSNVYAADCCGVRDAMLRGNADRLARWDSLHLGDRNRLGDPVASPV